MRERDARRVRMRHAVVAQSRLLEPVVQSFTFGDREGIAKALVVRPESHQASNDRLVRSVTFARPGKGSVELDGGALGCPADQASRDEADAASPRSMGT